MWIIDLYILGFVRKNEKNIYMSSFLPLFAVFSSFIFLIVFLHKWLSRASVTSSRRKRLPPSPQNLPIIGNLHQLGQLPHRSLQAMANRYGPLMLMYFGRVPVLVASSADAAQEMLKNQDLIFSNKPKSRIADRLVYGSRDVAFAPYGEHWRQMRSIGVLHLLSNKRVQSFRHVREEETENMIEKIRQTGSSKSAVNLTDLLVSLTNNIICRVALGRKYSDGDQAQKFRMLLQDYVELLGTFCVGDFIPWLSCTNRLNGVDKKVERVAKEFDKFLEGVVEEHRSVEKKGTAGLDFVDILLQLQKEDETDTRIKDESIKALVLDMFEGGTDTTFSALEWAFAELLKHPKFMLKLQKEVREKAQLTEDDLDKLPYLKAVLKESLRLHPPLPLLIPRELTQNTQVMGYDISAGTRVLINVWAIAMDPFLWENPAEFCPERFLESSIDFRGLHFELLPFGAGRRGCPGITFSTSVVEFALAKLVRELDFSLPDGETELDLDMTEAPGITVHRKNPLIVVATPHA